MTACRIAATSSSPRGLGALTGASGAPSLRQLAAAVSQDKRLRPFTLVVSEGPPPSLSVFGDLSKVDLARLRHLSMQIARADRAARYVDYAEAERLAGVLADRLTERYGRETLKTFVYRAIPRGGHIVLALLSYALGLPARCLAAGTEVARPGDERPLVVVDDCIISGVRFAEQWEAIGARPLILATLFAPADLQGRVEAERPFESVSAQTLADLAPELYGSGYESWRAAWRERMGGAGLWVGQPEYLCFAWNEPESSFYNGITGELEPGFRLVPPERCLHHRSESRGGAARVEYRPAGPGPLHAAPAVVAARVADGRLAVADFSGAPPDAGTADAAGASGAAGTTSESAECFLLEDSAADMWTLLLEHGTTDAAARAFCELYDVDPARAERDVEEFAASLINMGLLIGG